MSWEPAHDPAHLAPSPPRTSRRTPHLRPRCSSGPPYARWAAEASVPDGSGGNGVLRDMTGGRHTHDTYPEQQEWKGDVEGTGER